MSDNFRFLQNAETIQYILNLVLKNNNIDFAEELKKIEEELNTKADTGDINKKLNKKVDKEEGMGLSSNDYTDTDRIKLAGLANYDDTDLRNEVENKVDKTGLEAALNSKVNVEKGKGLSSNDYTNEEKAKLAGFPNVITDNLPELDYQELDNTETPYGIYKLINIPGEKTGACDLLFAYFSDYDSGYSYEYYYNQTRFCHDGTILKRISINNLSWEEWSEVKTPIVDKLTSTANYAALSANMGRVLNESKVDKEDGKGLSEADFTNAEKEKLESLYNYDDTQLRKLIIPKVAEADIDKLTDIGLYLITNISVTKEDDDVTQNSWYEYSTEGDLLHVSNYTYYYNGEYNERGHIQIRYCANGKILQRVDDAGFGEWTAWKDVSDASIKIVNTLTSDSTTSALSANMGRVLNEKITDVVHYKGEVNSDLLPDAGNHKGDVYKIEKYLLSSKYIYNEWQPVYGELQSGWGFSFHEDILADGEDMSVYIPVNIYDTSHNILGTGELYFRGEISLWVFETQTVPLTENETYYIERADKKTPADLESTTLGYAIYNGESFDKFYNEETVDNKIAEVKKWKTLIDTTLTEEQGGVSVIRIEMPNGEILKTITRMRLLIDIQSMGDGIPSQILQVKIGDYNSSAYSTILYWSSVKCNGGEKLKYRGITEFFPTEKDTGLRQCVTFISPPTVYDGANASGNVTKIPNSLSVNNIDRLPPYLFIALASGGIMAAGTRILLEVFE